MNKKFSVSVLCLLVAAVFIYSQRVTLSKTLIERVAEQRMGTNAIADLEDGLHVILCGAGGPLPDPKRSGPCVAVVAGNTLLIVDAGSGGSRNLATMFIPQGAIDAQLLTHFHSDHIDGLGEMAMMRWVNAANTSPLPVIGPLGTQAVVDGFNQSYAPDAQYRHAHHTDLVAPLSGTGMVAREFTPPADGERVTVFEQDGLTVSAFTVDHEPVHPAVAYRFDYKGRSVVISGDTAKSANLEAMSKGVDLLVHEALNRELVGIMNSVAKKNGLPILEQITYDIMDYHTSPVEVAEIARDAKVGHLMFYHVVPALVAPGMESVFVDGVDEVYEGGVTLGLDGSLVSLLANGDEIHLGELMFN
jgi:ribonuclease Z